MPLAEVNRFKTNLGYARQMVATASVLAAQLTTALDVSDLLRAALVQGVSAFDYFIHEEVRVRMLQWQGQASTTWPAAFRRFNVAMESVAVALSGPAGTWLEDEIRLQHGHLAFQQPDRVADGLRLVTDKPLWETLGTHMGEQAADLKRRLKLIVDRRNKIAHEADFDPTPPPSRYPITATLVTDSLDFLEQVAEAIVATI